MDGQDNNRGANGIPACVSYCRRYGREAIRVNITFGEVDQLAEVHDWLEQFAPVLVFIDMDMGTFHSHFVGAHVDGVYCSAGITLFVWALMLDAIRERTT